MTPVLNNKGYYQIGLSENSKIYRTCVHIIVALKFIPNLENKPEVNHKDGNKANNDSQNLEWCTRSENMLHYFHMLKQKKCKSSKVNQI